MPHTKTEIFSFLNEPLPNDVLQATLNTVEAFGTLKATCSETNTTLVEQLLLVKELQIVNSLCGENHSVESVLAELTMSNSNSVVYKQSVAYQLCKTYIQDVHPLFRVIPASVFLRVNCCIKTLNPIVLSDPTFTGAHDSISAVINDEVFRTLYGLNNGHHVFIRIAAAYFLLCAMLPNHEFNVLALDLLFSAVVHDKLLLQIAPVWLAKFAVLCANWGFDCFQDSIEKTFFMFISYLKDEFSTISLMMQKLKCKSINIAESIMQDFTKTYSDKLSELLCNNLLFRNTDFVNYLNVTPMTAIKYAKALEEKQLISGIKLGREKVYINRGLVSLIQE